MAVVVEVADERDEATVVLESPLDFRHRFGRFWQIDRHPYQLRTCLGEFETLLRCCRNVGRIGTRHRLDDDRGTTTDLDVAHSDADAFVEFDLRHVFF
jgi:hypothetical protein